jgi:hypothetical protein
MEAQQMRAVRINPLLLAGVFVRRLVDASRRAVLVYAKGDSARQTRGAEV